MRALCAAMLLASTAHAAEAFSWLGPAPKLPAKKVVTLAPSLTDTVLALGGGAALAGVSRFDERSEVAGLPRVGGFIDPSVEAVVALKPDVLMVQKSPGNQKPVEKIAELKVPVVAFELTTIEDVLAAITEVGRILGQPEKARQLVDDIRATRASLQKKAKARAVKPKVLLVYGFSPLVVAGPGSYADDMLRDVGAVNVAQKAPTPYPVFSAEQAVVLKPDVVIDAADVSDGREAIEPLLKSARWVKPKSKDMLHPGPSLGRALVELEALLGGK